MQTAAAHADIDVQEKTVSSISTIKGAFEGTDVFIHQALFDEHGFCMFLDITGHEPVLRSLIAMLALNKPAVVDTAEQSLRLYAYTDAMGKRDRWLSKQWRIGNGTTSNAILIHPAMTKILSKKDDIAFGVVSYEGNKQDHLKAVKLRMRQALPAYIDDEHINNAMRVLAERNAMVHLDAIGSLHGTVFNFKREDFINEMMPAIFNAKEVVKNNMTLIDFMANLGPSVVDAVRARLAPVHTVNDDADETMMGKLKRRLFRTQSNAVHAAVQGFRSGLRQAFNVAEMSCGKTIMSIATSYLFSPRVKAWVLCPPQLVEKWIREIHMTVQDAYTVNLNGYWATGWILRTARERSLPTEKPCYMVIGRVQNRMSRHLTPAAIRRKDLPKIAILNRIIPQWEQKLLELEAKLAMNQEDSKTEHEIYKVRNELDAYRTELYHANNILCCPKCATPITFTEEKEGEDGKKVAETRTATVSDLTDRRLFCEHVYTIRKKDENDEYHDVEVRCNEALWQYSHEKAEHADMAVQRFNMMERWLSIIPGISKEAATRLINENGIDRLIDAFSGYDMATKLELLYPAKSRRRKQGFYHLKATPFTLTPNDIPPFMAFKKKMPPQYRDFLIPDEAHEAKADDSAQGIAYGTMAQKVKASIPLTGTVLGGFASDIQPLLFRSDPHHMKARGYGHGDVNQYQADEGILETIIQHSGPATEHKTAVGEKSKTRTKKLPGFSPSAIARDLLPRSIFVRMDDIRKEILEISERLGGKLNILPSYNEVFVSIPMDETLKAHFDRENHRLETLLDSKEPVERSTGMHCLMSYLDRAHEDTDISPKWMMGRIPAASKDPDYLTPKEQELIKICQREKLRGRKVMVYVEYSGTRNCQPRVQEILERHGLKAKILSASSGGSSEKREAWIQKQCENGLDVLICHPKLVATGLDLLEFKTIVNFQVGFSIYTLRQAARRSWRIGQKEPVRVYFLCFKGTYQEGGLTHMAKKLRCSLDTEGILEESAIDGLLDDDDTSLSAIARMLIEGSGLSMTDMIETVDGEDLSGEFQADITNLPSEEQIQAIINGADPADVFAKSASNDDVIDEYEEFERSLRPIGNTMPKPVRRVADPAPRTETASITERQSAEILPLFAEKVHEPEKQGSLFDWLGT